MFKAPAHVIISWTFLILIGIALCYSCFFYPNNHPISCVIKSYTGKDCVTCGFSRAFSCYTHLQIKEGKSLNPLSWPVFLFFIFQFILRIVIILRYLITKLPLNNRLILTDVLISISGFLLAFLPILFKF
ncbi:MAG: hypothetical protein JWO32_347 [Bacteroidetes bacterium]|nr:hypothetical protein [Bacteroidota bacterium]